MFNKQLVAIIAIIAIFSGLGVSAEDQPVEKTAALAICDHNGDGNRDLADVGYFATCQDTFDANDDGEHDLSDISAYASNNQDPAFCSAFKCTIEKKAELVVAETVSEPEYDPGHPVCDHSGDGKRNLTDVSLFAQCAETFDANHDGIHDVSDVSLYAQNKMNDDWCGYNFDCIPKKTNPDPITSGQSAAPILTAAEEVTLIEKTGAPYAPWCSALLGALKGYYNGGTFNQAINLIGEEYVIDLSDVSAIATMYYAGIDDACKARFQQANDCVDSNVSWCDALEQDLMDSPDYGDLSDVSSVASVISAENQAACLELLNLDLECTKKVQPPSAFTSGGVTSPEVFSINSAVSCNQVDITWNTSNDSLTWLVYGETNEYGQEYKSEDYTANHAVSLFDLPYDTTFNYMVKTLSSYGGSKESNNLEFNTLSAAECGVVLGEKITQEVPEPKVLGVKEDEEKPADVCTYGTPDEDVLGQTEWADGTLLRGCGPEVYRIENQTKHHIKSLEELFNYIGQRIYNVTNDILDLF